jgi:hypothetical protein
MAHLHDRHAAAAPVEEFLADSFEDGKRKRSWTGVEIVDALGGLCGNCRGAQEGQVLSLPLNFSATEKVSFLPSLTIQSIRNYRPFRTTRGGFLFHFALTRANSTRLRMGSIRSARTRTLSPRCHSSWRGFVPRLPREPREPRPPAALARATMA